MGLADEVERLQQEREAEASRAAAERAERARHHASSDAAGRKRLVDLAFEASRLAAEYDYPKMTTRLVDISKRRPQRRKTFGFYKFGGLLVSCGGELLVPWHFFGSGTCIGHSTFLAENVPGMSTISPVPPRSTGPTPYHQPIMNMVYFIRDGAPWHVAEGHAMSEPEPWPLEPAVAAALDHHKANR